MADDVKQLLVAIDASTALLRQNLLKGDQLLNQYERGTNSTLDRVDKRFAEVGKPLAGIGATVAKARAEVATLGNSVDQVERRIRASSAGIKSALLASASGIAAAFSADQIRSLADGYTSYTNQLKVAGLEGVRLKSVQGDLFAVAQRYGVELESVGTLYGRLSQGAKELGASQSDLLKFSRGVGAALKIQGGDPAAAKGALLQLTQALGSTMVRAEEFNSVNEGARPILQAVANGIDRFGGSVSKLRNEVIAGKLTSKEFFEGFLKGTGQLEAQAAKSNLTIASSFVVIRNALSKYIGEADQGANATGVITGAVISLANNLDTIVPALTTIALAYGGVKAGAVAFSLVTGVVAKAAEADAILARQVLLGNASFVSRSNLAAASAQAVAAAAATEVASIENTIAARSAERADLIATIEAERALAAERRAQAVNFAAQNASGGNRTTLVAAQARAENDATFATQRLTTARQRLAVVDGELAVAEGALAGAETRAAVASEAAAAATARASIASRAGAAAARLFSGALTLIGGSVAGGAAVLAIGALVGAIIHFRAEAQAADERNRATARSMVETAEASRLLNTRLVAMTSTAAAASSGIAQVGAQSMTARGQVLAFAGAVGEAAQKLYQLAQARRREQQLAFAQASVDAERRANEAQARIDSRNRSSFAAPNGGSAMAVTGGAMLSNADQRANADDARIVAANREQQRINREAGYKLNAIPLGNFIGETDRIGGRDVPGELARAQRDLAIARRTKNQSLIQSSESKIFGLKQYTAYRKQGLEPDVAGQQAAEDVAAYRSGTATGNAVTANKAAATEANKASRAAAAEKRKEEAAARDAAADARAYTAAERQANNDIAAARADLTNSAADRAQIERDRIESERQSREAEIADQAAQGRFGSGETARTRTLELQRLNNQRAALEQQAVDAREKQRIADEALAVESAGYDNQIELLQKQEQLTTSLKDRRAIELKILDLQYQEEDAKLAAVIASHDSTEAEKKIARQKRAILAQLKAGDVANVEKQNAGPLEQYRDRLKAATGDMKTSLQSVAVDGLQSIEDGFVGVISGTETVAGAFKKMASAIIADLARIAIEKAIVKTIGQFVGFSGGGALGDVPGYAGGGSPGGLIQGPGSGTSDSILAILGGGKGAIRVSNEEFIMNARATRENLPLLYALNSGKLRGFASGGSIGAPISSPAIPSLATSAGVNGSILVRVALTEDLDARIDNRATGVAVQVVRQAAPELVEAAKSRTITELRRPGL